MRRSVILLGLLALLGCGDGEGDGTSFIRVTVDGVVWSAEASEGEVAYYVEGGDGIVSLAIRTRSGIDQIVSIVLPLPPELGDHPLDGATARAAYSACPNYLESDCIYYEAVAEYPGTLTISHVDPSTGVIEGSFSFVGRALGDPEGEAKPVTAGKFRIFAPSVFILE
jgi:hypothetical protein